MGGQTSKSVNRGGGGGGGAIFYIIYWFYESLPHFNDELISYLYVYCFSVCVDGYESLPERETCLFLLISTN